MTPTEELDLARAKEIASAMGLDYDVAVHITPKAARDFLFAAKASRLGDEARGLRVVPKEATGRMISEGESAASIGIGKPVDDEALPRVFSAMLAASPFAPEPEEKG